MSVTTLTPPSHLSPRQTLSISSQAPKLLSSLTPSRLPWPLTLLTTSDTPEKWQTYENLLIACLKTGDDESAFLCLEELISRFGPTNERVQALRGLYQEAMAKDDKQLQEVLEQYEEILAEVPGNMHVRKRRVALLRSMGRQTEAVKALVKILDVSPVDAEAWAELGDTYAEIGEWAKAVYAWEEVLLVMANAWNVHARLGEIEWMWAQSVEANGEKTRLVSQSLRRYCRAIELCDDYLRGYYGLKLVSAIYCFFLLQANFGKTSGKLLELLPKTQKSSGGFDVPGDLAPPPVPAVESLNELATSKLGEMVRRGAARESGWDGYDEAELIAARALLDRDTQKVQR
ncbi:tetratricopeptide repeat domain-containing protein [Elsinoe ampelina]|uniref:ER membrane protein complex subunit 2 n=1 Tax=Elsinoe ampelina TaxID=302913 RepID=A0A6A6G7I4_9PEZI|nr:tetratricopeptide repeat domain-containing protein [Elsinoe ampelina]